MSQSSSQIHWWITLKNLGKLPKFIYPVLFWILAAERAWNEETRMFLLLESFQKYSAEHFGEFNL